MYLPAHVSRSIANRRAASAVEFALVAPFLMILILGMVEIGHSLMVKEMLSDAAQKACRTAAQPGKSTAQVQAEVDNIMSDNSFTGYSTVILLNGNPFDANGNPIDLINAVHNDKISIKVSIPVSQVLWTTSYFLPAQDVESETVVMLRQG